MGPTEINGLPAHVLLVHIVVVFVPLAAVLLVLSALWPAVRRRLGIITPIVALIALVSVPLATHAGEWLKLRVGLTPLVRTHAALGDGLLPWVFVMFVLAALVWALYAKQHWFLPGAKPADDDERVLVGAAAAAPAAGGAGAVETRSDPAAAGGAGTSAVPSWVRVTRVVAMVLAVVVSVGSVVEVYRIGDSGAKAAWDGSFSATPVSGPPAGH